VTWRRQGEVWTLGRATLRTAGDGSSDETRWIASLGDRLSLVRRTVAEALADVGAPPMATCSCGWPVERPGRRERLAGDLLEYCACSGGCGSTTVVMVESCCHARVGRSFGREDPSLVYCECRECGHTWLERRECEGEVEP
jgi:hypothetical protein